MKVELEDQWGFQRCTRTVMEEPARSASVMSLAVAVRQPYDIDIPVGYCAVASAGLANEKVAAMSVMSPITFTQELLIGCGGCVLKKLTHLMY